MAPRALLDYRVHSLEIISRGPVLTRTSKVFICHCLNSIHRIHRTRLIPISRQTGHVPGQLSRRIPLVRFALPAVLIQRSTRERAAPVAKLMSLLLREANLFDFLCDHVDCEAKSIPRRSLPILDVLRGACTRVAHSRVL